MCVHMAVVQRNGHTCGAVEVSKLTHKRHHESKNPSDCQLGGRAPRISYHTDKNGNYT